MASYPDLESVARARDLCAEAAKAQRIFAESSQEKVDGVVAAAAAAARDAAALLAREAYEETGFGTPDDKTAKNLFCATDVFERIRPLKTVGIIREDPDRGIVEIAEPVGVVAGILPSTNPTSTAIFKILIALKARDGIVLSPHPMAANCSSHAARLLSQAAEAAGAPKGIVGCLSKPTGAACRELMHDPHVALILATGGTAMVNAAYSAGKPAYGVGPGNVPVYVHESADPSKTVERVLRGKLFDNGTLCSSEQSLIVDAAISDPMIRHLRSAGAHFLSTGEQERLAARLFTPRLTVRPDMVGRSALVLAEQAGIKVPKETRVLVAPLEGVGRDYPLSAEKLSPVLAYFVVSDWKEGCRRCKEILRFGGAGHTLAVHAADREVILAFALEKPAFRIIANAPAATGAVGIDTFLPPSMTLGCGAMGGNITSDNIGPEHLINVKRLAFGRKERAWIPAAKAAPKQAADSTSLRQRIERFLDGSHLAPPADPMGGTPAKPGSCRCEDVAEFVCEDDVRRASTAKKTIRIDDKTIITPAARDLGNTKSIFRE